jgi:hypothetical protein
MYAGVVYFFLFSDHRIIYLYSLDLCIGMHFKTKNPLNKISLLPSDVKTFNKYA